MGRKVRVRQTNDPDQIFTEAYVCQLVKDAKAGVPVNVAKLRAGLIDAAKRFAVERAADANTVHREIARLHAAAQHRRFAAAAAALTGLSSPARDHLRQRDPRLPPLPQPADLLDPAKREKARAAVIGRCEIGGRRMPGRKRPSGRQSSTWKPELWAPKLNPHPEIRAAERAFIMWLQVAWIEATGKKVPVTAHRNNPGPFARLAQIVLSRLGVPHADVAQLINDLKRHADEVQMITDPVTSQDMKDPRDNSV
jgi:hypothetical protein